ncbi:MAG: glycosyltransferase [Desulfobacteraceae bacterium]|nr:glycosyltransferase [Desulfobacteraceae bacterium]
MQYTYEATRYHVEEAELKDSNNSHSMIIQMLQGIEGPVLDLGCATGLIGTMLSRRGVRVVGVEMDAEAADMARPHYEEVLTGDATAPKMMNRFDDGFFQAIVMGDIVEHLSDPVSFLQGWAAKLRDGGSVIISTPNLGHSSIIASLLSGSFAYRDSGILDHTHCRFFGLQSLLSLCLAAGLAPVELKRVRHDLFATEIPVEVDKISPKLLSLLKNWPEASTYQFVLHAVKKPAQEDLATLAARFSLPGASTENDSELNSLMEELEAKRREIRELHEHKDRNDKEACRLRDRMAELLESLHGTYERSRSGELPTPCFNIYDILIPVYNAYAHVHTCVTSVLRHTDPRHIVYLLDDASPDPKILPLLNGFATQFPNRVKVLPSGRNQGFVRNVNRGLFLSRNNVVILNSDTEVTAGWLERMDRCLRSSPNIGVVSPLSNNATILSVPVMNVANTFPEDLSVFHMAQVVSSNSPRAYPRIPTAVGFCMLISRKALQKVGPLDTVFGMGYGEECDFCMKAWNSGFEVVCCDDAYVQHYGEASFGREKQMDERREANQEILRKRWPSYHNMVFHFCKANPLRQVQEGVYRALTLRAGDPRPHVLHVVHNFAVRAGTELHTRQMIDANARWLRSTVAFPYPLDHLWTDMVSERPAEHLRVIRVARENTASEELFVGLPAGVNCGMIERNMAQLMAGGDYDIVHFQHLGAWNTLMLPFIAKMLGKKVIFTLHDYFLLCPEYNMVYPNMKACGKVKAGEHDEDCFRCLGEKRCSIAKKPLLLHEYLADRNEVVRRAVELADAIVVPSGHVKKLCLEAWGERCGEKVNVIPHGLNVASPLSRPARCGVLRVGFLGNMTDKKGGMVLFEAASMLRNKPVRFEAFGGLDPSLVDTARSLGIVLHGPYQGEDLPNLLQKVDIVVIPSVWAETFCLTLSEAQALGVPVIASDIGAIKERIIDGETGFLVPAGNSEALAKRLLHIASSPESLVRIAQNLSRRQKPKSVEENALEYAELYFQCLRQPGASSRLIRSYLAK